jgi:hypothetical protein
LHAVDHLHDDARALKMLETIRAEVEVDIIPALGNAAAVTSLRTRGLDWLHDLIHFDNKSLSEVRMINRQHKQWNLNSLYTKV